MADTTIKIAVTEDEIVTLIVAMTKRRIECSDERTKERATCLLEKLIAQARSLADAPF